MAQSSQGFQATVNTVPAPGVEGDFHTLNPFFHYPAGPGGLVAGTATGAQTGTTGILVGRFCWPEVNFLDPDNEPTVVNNWTIAGGAPIGILGRRQQGIITTFLAEASLLLPTGLNCAVISSADLWIVNRGTTQALINQKVYANFVDGSASFAATGTPTTGASCATASIAAEVCSSAGSIAGNVLTLTGATTGSFYPGVIISGAGVATGSQIQAQLSGTPLGAGTYALSIGDQSVASTTISGTYGLLSNGTVTGTLAVGNILAGAGGGGVTAGTVVWVLATGAGGTGGTSVVSPTQTVTSSTITVPAINVETNWYAVSSGVAGELVKVSRLPPIGA